MKYQYYWKYLFIFITKFFRNLDHIFVRWLSSSSWNLWNKQWIYRLIDFYYWFVVLIVCVKSMKCDKRKIVRKRDKRFIATKFSAVENSTETPNDWSVLFSDTSVTSSPHQATHCYCNLLFKKQSINTCPILFIL